MKIRHEINLTCEGNTGSVAAEQARVLLDTTKYSGSCTYYFEIVSNASPSSQTISLRRVGTTTDDATITYTTQGRMRSSSFTPPSGTTEYMMQNGLGVPISVARIIIIQDTSSSNLTASESQFEIGGSTNFTTGTTLNAVAYPKYWNYDSSKWDGTCTFYLDATAWTSDTMYTATVTLQVADGTGDGFQNWTDVVSVTSTSLTPSRSRSTSFTPINGRNYQIASKISSSMGSHQVATCKIIVQQTGTDITKLQEEYFLKAQILTSTSNSYQYGRSLFDSAEWSDVDNSYYLTANATNGNTGALYLCKRINNGIPVPSSQIISPDNRQVSSRIYLGAMDGVDESVSGLSFHTSYKYAQSFQLSTAGSLKKACFKMIKTGSPTGTLTAYLYAHSGTYGTSSVATGTALATSTNTISVADVVVDTNVANAKLYTFDFSGYDLSASTPYVISLEWSGGTADGSNYLMLSAITSSAHSGNHTYNIGGGWVAVSDYDLTFSVFTDAANSMEVDWEVNPNSAYIHDVRILTNVTKAVAPAIPRVWFFVQGG